MSKGLAMNNVLNEAGRDLLYRSARTHNNWLDQPVADDTLRELYELMKWAPTSANSSPMRIVFLRTAAAKERLLPALIPANVEKTMTAPVTAVLAYDLKFYDKLPRLFPHNLRMRELFANAPELADITAKRNASLQGAYFILAARALGLDCGPMSGFDNAAVDGAFFAVNRDVKSNFLCNLGYGDPAKLFPRNPRLDFNEACELL
jgi:3-hydroxypropanoate dehydrogenase